METSPLSLESFDWAAHRPYLQKTRPQPMFDRAFGAFLREGMSGAFGFDNDLNAKFFRAFERWLHGSKLNRLSGLSEFPHRDLISGVTHSLDDLHVHFGSRLVTMEQEYAYHRRMRSDMTERTLSTLQAGDVLVFAVPFSYHGDLHPETGAILDRCQALGIPVHVDSAWFGCLRDFEFDYDHPAIRSVSFSLSKGLGLGSHRVGVRYSRERHPGPVSIINDFGMEIRGPLACGLRFMENFGSDYLQNRYGRAYGTVCERMNLRPTKAIHLAFAQEADGQWYPVGLRPFLRFFVDGWNEFKPK